LDARGVQTSSTWETISASYEGALDG
jgi:hypothetical protein